MGFAALPNQLHRKSVKKGFDFTLMVAGLGVLERGLVVSPQETLAVPSPDLGTWSVHRGVRPGEIHPHQQPVSHQPLCGSATARGQW